MGWSSGSRLFGDIIDILKSEVDDEEIRAEIYARMISVFEDHDCDTLDECVGDDPVFDNVFNNQYPADIITDDDAEGWDDQDNSTF